MIIDTFKDRGMTYFAEHVKEGKATNYANTFILSSGGRDYVIDSSCGRNRFSEIKAHLKRKCDYTILCTHYHNDHIANNGRLAGKTSPIIYHKNASNKVPYLRTNGTGQILKMYREMQKEGFLRRLGFFSDTFINLLLKRKAYSKYVAEPLLFIMSYLYSLKNIGLIYSGKKHVRYLEESSKTGLEFNGMETTGWRIDESIYAFEAPGHSDCHTVFYHRTGGILVAGDALNFLTPNDIQFGTLKETIDTQKFLLELVKKENIEILCQGHYPPVTGSENVVNYISDIIEKHEHVYNLTSSFIRKMSRKLTFDELYRRYCSIDDPVIKKLTRITFPRSTLVFLDVYLLKMLEETGKDTGEF